MQARWRTWKTRWMSDPRGKNPEGMAAEKASSATGGIMKILDHFPPGFSPRPLQADVLTKVEAAFDSGKRFVVVEAPPGTGKSHIAATLARRYGPTYICTLTKQLQAQYLKLFEGIGARELKGRGAFTCTHPDETRGGVSSEISCEIGGRRHKKANACVECPYRAARAKALAAPITLCNYASYIYNIRPRKNVDPVRPLLVLDEGHEVEEVLMDHISISIDASKLPIKVTEPVPPASSVEDCFGWLEKFIPRARAELAWIEDGISGLSEKAQIELERLHDQAVYAMRYRDAEEWISEPLDNKKSGFVLKPLTVSSFGHRLFQYGTRVLVMSATILDAEKLAETVGIAPGEMEFISTPCPFPVENRGVTVTGLDMSMRARDESWPLMVEQVEDIMDAHSDEKGLILTTSNQMLNYLMENLSSVARGRLVQAYGKTRQEQYDRHCDSPDPTVLIASGYWEGADLHEDLSRFQIIPSVPRPRWAGQVAARGKMDPVWYRWRSYTKLIQGVGRSVRSETDSASTYILDAALRDEAERSDSLLPGWFRDALEFA